MIEPMGRSPHRVHHLSHNVMNSSYTAASARKPAHESHTLAKILGGGLIR